MRPVPSLLLLVALSIPARAQCPQVQKIFPANGDDAFGTAAALDGDLAVIASGDIPFGFPDSSVHLFRYDPGVRLWLEAGELFPGDGGYSYTYFGSALALAGDWLFVGHREHPENDHAGVTWVYRQDAGSGQWLQAQKLTMTDGGRYAEFGCAAALDGTRAVIGARLRDDPVHGDAAGGAYVYHYDVAAASWILEATLVDGFAGEGAGSSVALSGDAIAVGAPGGTHSIQGVVYLYRRAGSSFDLEQRLVPLDGGGYDQFGTSVAMVGDRLLVGSPYHRIGSSYGAAYLYAYDASAKTWQLETKLAASDTTGLFGTSVAMSSEQIVVGAAATDDTGAAYVFRELAGAWWQDEKLVAADAKPGDDLGTRVALGGDRLLATAPGDDNVNGYDAGAGYLFSAAELFLSAPERVLAGQPITLATLCGSPGAPVLLAAVGFNGSGVFLPVVIGAFAADHTLTVTGLAPPDLTGDNVTFQSFKLGLGQGRVVSSAPVLVKFR
ncbi:MAG: hypothetical protein U1E76_25335 [Planctomycetota bacterium]